MIEQRRGAGASKPSPQIGTQNRHLEIVRAVVVFIVDEQHPDKFLADIHLG
jgi:hypothetical protein